MSAGARIASAFHPTDLMAKGAKERAGDQHVVYNVMREHDIVVGRPNQISKHKIIRVIVGCGGDTADFLQGLRLVAITAPSAKRIPSSMSASRTPDVISTDMPSASSDDQKLRAGTPR